jgi:hypothetical protein
VASGRVFYHCHVCQVGCHGPKCASDPFRHYSPEFVRHQEERVRVASGAMALSGNVAVRGVRATSSEPAPPAKLRAKRSLSSVNGSKSLLLPRTSGNGSRATCLATDQGPYRSESTPPAEVTRTLPFAHFLPKWQNILASSSPLKSAIAGLPSGEDTVRGDVQLPPSSTTQKARTLSTWWARTSHLCECAFTPESS